MLDIVKNVFRPFAALAPDKKAIVLVIVGLGVALFAGLFALANKTDFRPLFSNLSGEDAGEIVRKLKEQKVPYEISPDGKAVSVPAAQVYELRLTLAADGLPQGGGVGFEIFDRKNFGMTEFVQKLNYTRALQGELARTIAQLTGVEKARVHLVIPEKSLYSAQEKAPTASVVLTMKGARTLKENDVQGISHLVAAAVEGLNTDNVTILDSKGRLLNRAGLGDSTKKTTAMLETQATFEKNTEERLQSLLNTTLGSNRSVARVTAVFDFKQVERYEEKYDPDSAAVRSEQKSSEEAGGAPLPAGVPGVPSNLGRTAPSVGAAAGASRNDETRNYEVSRSTARIVEPVGTVQKLSVAIMVDGKYDKNQGGKGKYLPLTPEELAQIETLVKGAIGFNAERGDQVSVVNVPFSDSAEESGSEEAPAWWTAPILMAVAKNGAIALGFLLLVALVIRPLLAYLKSSRPVADEAMDQVEALAAARAAQMAKSQMAGLRAGQQAELVEKVKADPYVAAQIVQNMLKRRDDA